MELDKIYELGKKTFQKLYPSIAAKCIGFHLLQEVKKRFVFDGELGELANVIEQDMQGDCCPMKYERPDLCQNWHYLNDYARKVIDEYQKNESVK